MSDEYSDILGSDTLPLRQKPTSSSLSFTFKTAFIVALLLIAYIVVARAWDSILKWREKSYRLSLRRSHGIPDNDHRPFNVAYAAVQRAKEQKEKEHARIRRADAALSLEQQLSAPPSQIRHRPGNQRGVDSSRSGAPVAVPGSSTPSNSYLPIPQSSQSNRVTFADGYNTSASPLEIPVQLAASSSSPLRRSGRKSIGILKSSVIDDDRKKRERGNDDEDGDIAKKTRVEGDEFIDGDEEAEWQDSHNFVHSRGSKRGLGEEDDTESSTLKGKRQRQVFGDKSEDYHDMDVDAEDYAGSVSRGKKRDRDEAGSSFGGEREEGDEEELDTEEEVEKARRRKRRNKRRSDANSTLRGKKRDRDLEDETGDSDDESRASRQTLKKKRGKKASSSTTDEEKLSDVSMDDSPKGRKIGEEWTSNGVQYKIGPNAQRLRLELVKKARQKFVMPMDSVHPDRKANLRSVC
ncbi:hypothetical protein BT96DRAFT_397445 [Gymnopus androsaceus JB14]|uniref:Uncharacterized protein n=1 Tax=Gymnopus androsaceus JB14 TaxID=1447944 RepID=A0A6A4I7T4_9AGAR|nr:hypothetical protein BT96DRAFT_397445 [Gymnopus androsaceus JB14]